MFPRVLAEVPDQVLAGALIEKAGLIVNPGYQFGRDRRCFRICFAQDERIWEAALDRLIATIEDLSR